jgi:hypothetical protein
MISIGGLQKLIESLNNDISDYHNLLIALSIFVGLNLILAGINIIVQFKLKNKEKEINGHNLREKNRIEHQEELYSKLENLTYYDGNPLMLQDYSSQVSGINAFLTKKRLYLNKDLIALSQEFTDYFLQVLSDYRRKSYEKEMKLLEEYCTKFNNVRAKP